jgi:excinuclease ABC subunit B
MSELIIRRGLDEPDTTGEFVPHKPARPEKSMGGKAFKLVSEYTPSGDQPTAIAELSSAAKDGDQTQVLLGVTGSGKTFTMAKVIEELQRPALILAPNKILAAQLYGEFKSFFPENAVEYFVSYYDYYQPEAYVPRSDTYIEKESSVNEAIDRMRHSATRALLERDDVIIVASVSCLYGIGSVETYSAMIFDIKKGEAVDQRELIRKLVALQYKRNDAAFARGNFRVRGDSLEIFPSHYEDMAWRISFFGDDIEEISEFDPLTGKKGASLDKVRVYANSHYVTPGPTMKQAAEAIKFELAERLKELHEEGRLLEAQRLEQRTNFDLEMIAATGRANRRRHCSSTCPKTRCCSSMKATRRCRRSGRCRRATTAARSRSPNMVFACPPVSTTARCGSTNGTRCARRPSRFRPRRARGRWNRPAASSPNRSSAPPG